MNRWIPYAFVRISFFFMLGISVGIFFPGVLNEYFAKLIILVAFLAYTIITIGVWKRRSLRGGANLKVAAGLVGLASVFCAGLIRVDSNTETKKTDHIIHRDESITFLKVVITTAAIEKINSWKTEAEVEEVNENGQWKTATGKIMLYLSKKDFAKSFEYGDVLLVKGSPQLVPGPSNPEEFDYQRFLRFKNIYHQKYVRTGDARKLGFAPPSWIDHYALKTRHWADSTIKNNVSGNREKGLASALVLGVTDGLDNELLSAYKATGTLHVLAVSGLHVGILYGIIVLLLTPLKRFKCAPWIVALFSVVVLWGYAFVTGLSPSVLRAVTMFSFVALAKPGGHRTNIYNTLAASAFLILWYDPFFIMSVGFQLSYLAVLGIVYIQPGLYHLWNPSNRILDEIWKVTCVSVAAQVATFSLGLLYFHQFPNYFLVSNLFAIPGSFGILVLGLATLAASFLSPVASTLGLLLEWIIKALNAIMFIMEDLPFSRVENVYITPLQCWILIGLLLAVLLLLHTRKFVWVKIIFFLGVIFSGLQWYHYHRDVNIRQLTVYNIGGHTAVDLIENGKAYFIADSSLKTQLQKVDFHVSSNRIKCGVKRIYSGVELQENRQGCSIMVWSNLSVLQIHEPEFRLPEKVRVDFVIVSNDALTNVEEFTKQISANRLILDSSNSRFNVFKLMRQGVNNDIEIYSVADQGAFELKI